MIYFPPLQLHLLKITEGMDGDTDHYNLDDLVVCVTVLFHRKTLRVVYVLGSLQIDTTLAFSDARIGVNMVYVV